MNNDIKITDLTPENIAEYGVCGYKDVTRHQELRDKIAWFNEYYPKGLRIKALISEKGGYQGMLEYIPGRYAHRPVNAEGYLFIHCIFVGFKNAFKGKGYASALIDECIEDARQQGLSGVSVVTRKGSFMASSQIFLKKGFTVTDKALPDFELLALAFDPGTPVPSFKKEALHSTGDYREGLTIIRSPQCPYTGKNVAAILDTAQAKYGLKTRLIDLKDAESAQNVPCPFGTFCMIYDGKVISHHPISNGRFENIISRLV